MRSHRLLLGGWFPECAYRASARRPEVGWLVAIGHSVWGIAAVDDVRLNAAERASRELWEKRKPGTEWKLAPFRVTTRWVGGARPDWLGHDGEGTITIRSDRHLVWWVYEGGRWPQCSCCGEPMPCRAAVTDARVEHEMETLARLEAKVPGACWCCQEPISARQRAVTYGGENLDMPGGPPVVFHTRAGCRGSAEAYEGRWLEANPAQPRILTYPYCRGNLVTHNDGASECLNGHPDCRGHLTHDHGSVSGCRFVGGGCGRGCDPAKSRVYRTKRPVVRDPGLPQDGHPRGFGRNLLALGGDPTDTRPGCPGTLVVHSDGTEECTAGGLDDCWDGSKYRHDHRRDCADLTHGCPKCEVTS